MPSISIIIPTFNRSALVAETVESILDQDFKDYEIVVIDDGSTDDTRLRLEDYIADRKIKYHYQSNQGRSAARNHGMRNAAGQYFMFLDSDDLLCPGALKTLYSAAVGSSSGLVAGTRRFIDNAGRPFDRFDPVRPKRTYLDAKLKGENIRELFLPPSTYIVRRDVALAVGGFDGGVEPAEDLDFFIKCCNAAAVTITERLVVRMRRHEGNTDETELRRASIRIAERNLINLQNRRSGEDHIGIKRLKALWLYRMADDFYCIDETGPARRNYLKVIFADPSLLLTSNAGHILRQVLASQLPVAWKRRVKNQIAQLV